MFRIRKSEFHFWFSFPNLSPEIAAKMAQKAKIAAKNRVEIDAKKTR